MNLSMLNRWDNSVIAVDRDVEAIGVEGEEGDGEAVETVDEVVSAEPQTRTSRFTDRTSNRACGRTLGKASCAPGIEVILLTCKLSVSSGRFEWH